MGCSMPDLLSIVERGLKAVRYGFFSVNDQLALCLDGFCHTPAVDYVDHTEHLDPDWTPSSAASPSGGTSVTVETSTGGGSEEIDAFPSVPSEPHQSFGEATAVVAYRVICPSCHNHITGLYSTARRAEQAFSEKGGYCRTCKPSLYQQM